MKNNDKTNVMRVLDAKKIAYESHSYEADATLSGEQIAAILGEEASSVFKTLVTQGKTGQYYVFVIPVAEELDLKKAAKASGEKSIAMIKQKDLLPLTFPSDHPVLIVNATRLGVAGLLLMKVYVLVPPFVTYSTPRFGINSHSFVHVPFSYLQ